MNARPADTPEQNARQALLVDLLARAPRYHFVPAVRILQSLLGQAAPTGATRPDTEGIRFSGTRSLAFAPADLESVRSEPTDAGGVRYRVTSRFLSLLGASSVLPHAYTERLRGELGEPEPSALGFVDLLHHRLHSLAFQVLTRTRPFEDRAHPLYRRAAALVGLGAAHPFSSEIGLLGGLIGPRSRGPKALEQCVRAYFGVACRLEPLLDLPLPIPRAQRSILGHQAHRLRAGAVLGRRRRQPMRSFGLTLGPVTASQAGHYLPGGSRHPELRALIARFDRDGLRCRVTVAIDGATVPVARASRGTRLNRSVRLGGRPAAAYGASFALDPLTEEIA